MTSGMFSTPDGATPIDADEADQLIPDHLVTRDQLNAWEQKNIINAVTWLERTRLDVVDEQFIRELHLQMFNETWEWAGRYRRSNKNIGVDWPHISSHVADLVDTVNYWIINETFSLDEIAIRAHHRLVLVHPFPNGNGRHARLWADAITESHDRPRFMWNSSHLDVDGDIRLAYINALRRADTGDYGPLFTLLLTNR